MIDKMDALKVGVKYLPLANQKSDVGGQN